VENPRRGRRDRCRYRQQRRTYDRHQL